MKLLKWFKWHLSIMWYAIVFYLRVMFESFSLTRNDTTRRDKDDEYEPEVDTENLRRQEVIAHTINFLKITGIPEDKYSNQHESFVDEFSVDVRLESVRKANIENGDTTDKDKFSWKDEDDNCW